MYVHRVSMNMRMYRFAYVHKPRGYEYVHVPLRMYVFVA